MTHRDTRNAGVRWMVALALLLIPAMGLQAQLALVPGTPYNVINQNSGKCIGASYQKTDDGTVVEMYSCANGSYSSQAAQTWIFNPAGDGFFQVSASATSSQSWNVVNNGTANGSRIQLWNFTGNPNEEFKPVSLGGGYYRFVGQGSGRCLDVPNNSTANSVQLDISDCNGSTGQAFKLASPSGSACAAAPKVPVGLTATAITGTTALLNWSAAWVPNGCSVSGYTVYKNGTALATVNRGTSYSVSGLTPSTTYNFAVAATDAVGSSPKSPAISATTAASGTGEGPYTGVPAAVPGTLQAEDYDTGGQGLGYNVTSINGTDNGYRADGVDLEVAASPAIGADLGWTAAGQWFRYTVYAATAGKYTVSFQIASTAAVTDAFHLSNAAGTNLSGAVAVPNTGDWQAWQKVTADVNLPAGQQTLTLYQDNGGWNLDSMTFAPSNGGSFPGRVSVLKYLNSISGNHTAIGIENKGGGVSDSDTMAHTAGNGQYPSFWSADFGFGGAASPGSRAAMIQVAKQQWAAGAIVQLIYHNCPLQWGSNEQGCAWNSGPNPIDGSYNDLTDAQWVDLTTPGGQLYGVWTARLDTLAVYFQQLKDAGVAPLFRPFHEMNGKWAWWQSHQGPNGSARLFQLTHDYLVNNKGLDNIVWVWNVQDYTTLAADVSTYTPGASYFDVAALDVYNTGYTAGNYNAMLGAAAGKPIGVAECQYLPTPSLLASQPLWTFVALWPDYLADPRNVTQIPALFNDPQVLTLSKMPGW